ncbi:MAG: hypothetical protein QOE61_3588, partial [Micromonosporaceae bacterium]|nr:hypothetical protein [Micromonosporaceae bacterium]
RSRTSLAIELLPEPEFPLITSSFVREDPMP